MNEFRAYNISTPYTKNESVLQQCTQRTQLTCTWQACNTPNTVSLTNTHERERKSWWLCTEKISIFYLFFLCISIFTRIRATLIHWMWTRASSDVCMLQLWSVSVGVFYIYLSFFFRVFYLRFGRIVQWTWTVKIIDNQPQQQQLQKQKQYIYCVRTRVSWTRIHVRSVRFIFFYLKKKSNRTV